MKGSDGYFYDHEEGFSQALRLARTNVRINKNNHETTVSSCK